MKKNTSTLPGLLIVLAISTGLLFAQAITTPVGNVMTTDINGNGHNLTNAGTVNAAHFTGDGSGLTGVGGGSSAYATTAGFATNSGFATNAAGTGGVAFGSAATNSASAFDASGAAAAAQAFSTNYASTNAASTYVPKTTVLNTHALNTGTITLTASDVGADASGAASAAQAAAQVFAANASNLTNGTIPSARVPTLNQNTTGSAGSVSGTLVATGTGTTTMSNSLGNFTLTVASSGTITTSNNTTAFANNQTAPAWFTPVGPVGISVACVGDSRTSGGANIVSGTGGYSQNDPNGYSGRINSWPGNLQTHGFFSRGYVINEGLSGAGLGQAIANYSRENIVTAVTCTNGSKTATITGSTTGITNGMWVGGMGIPIGTYCNISGTTLTFINPFIYPASVFVGFTGTTGSVNLTFATAALSTNNQSTPPPHILSNAINGIPSYLILNYGINDTINQSASCIVNGTTTVTFNGQPSCYPYPGEVISSTHFTGGTTTVVSVSTTGFVASAAASGSATETVTYTANSTAFLSAYAAYVNGAIADGTKVVVVTIPKAYDAGHTGGESIRQAINTGLVSAYANGAVSGAQLCDLASNPEFATNDPTIYFTDGLHPNVVGNQLYAATINATAASVYSSAVTLVPHFYEGNFGTPQQLITPGRGLLLGDGLVQTPLILYGNGTATQITMDSGGHSGSGIDLIEGSRWELVTGGVAQELYKMASTSNVDQTVLNQTANLTAQSAAGNVVAVTPPALGTYRVGGYVNITAISVDILELEVTWTDENSAAQTQLLYPCGQTSALLSATGDYVFPAVDIRSKTGTAITLKTIDQTGGGTHTFDAGGTIQYVNY